MKTIFMIIDDDNDDKFFFKEATEVMLTSSECVEATDGADALQQLRKSEQLPDFIFLDVNMPRMDGRECLTKLKWDKKLKSIPVIMYSTSFSPESIEEFNALGAVHYLQKPTDINKLSNQISLAIQKGYSKQ